MRSARVVIIGGGVGGCSLAYHLSELGWTDVVLLEKGELTSGSTWHAAGLCTQFNASRNITRLLMYSLELYKSLEAKTGQAVDFHEVGSIRLASNTDRLDEYAWARSRAAGVGLDAQLLSSAAIAERWPMISTEGVVGGLWMPTDGYVDPSSITMAMAAGAKEKGVQINLQTRVTALQEKPDGGWVVETDKGSLECEILVNAAGMWAPRIGRMAGLDLPITPLEHHMIVTSAIPALKELPAELPVIRDPDRSFYVRQEVDSLLVGPFEKKTKSWATDGVPWEFEGKLLEPDLDRIQDVLLQAGERIEGVASAGIARFVNGPDGYTPDGRCLMGWTPGSATSSNSAGSRSSASSAAGARAGSPPNGSPTASPAWTCGSSTSAGSVPGRATGATRSRVPWMSTDTSTASRSRTRSGLRVAHRRRIRCTTDWSSAAR